LIMPRIMGIGSVSKLSKKHKPKKAGSFKGLGVVLEGSALKSKRYGTAALGDRRPRDRSPRQEMAREQFARHSEEAAEAEMHGGRTPFYPVPSRGALHAREREALERRRRAGLGLTAADHKAIFGLEYSNARVAKGAGCESALYALFQSGKAYAHAMSVGHGEGKRPAKNALTKKALKAKAAAVAAAIRACGCKGRK